MDIKDYCSKLQTELTVWKAKVYDVVRKFDKASSGDKEKVVPYINDIHIIIEELSERIEWLDKECPIEYEPYKAELQTRFNELKTKWDDVLAAASPT